MKKIILCIAVAAAANFANAEYAASLVAGLFYREDGSVVSGAKAAWVVDTQSGDFKDFKLNDGDFFSKGVFLDAQERDYILDLVDLAASDMLAYFSATIDLNDGDLPFSAGDTFAVVCFENDSDDHIVDLSTFYAAYSPAMYGEESDWVIPNVSHFIDFTALSIDADGNVPREYLTLSQIQVPEPSECALLLGLAGVALAFLARRR